LGLGVLVLVMFIILIRSNWKLRYPTNASKGILNAVHNLSD
jgi:hypothetical protein